MAKKICWNAFINNFDYLSSGGSGSNITLSPNTGGSITSDTFNLWGGYADTVRTMETYNDSGNFLIANQAYETQYVVDASIEIGLKGTFTTIQDALDQAKTDGCSLSNWKKITVRSGTYLEDLLIPAGVIIEGMSFGDSGFGGLVTTQLGTIIQGTHDVESIAGCVFRYTSFLNNGDNYLFDISADGFSSKMLFDSCTFSTTSTTIGVFRNIHDLSTFRTVFFNCTISSLAVYPVYDFVFSNGSTGTLVSFLDCIFGDCPPSAFVTSLPSAIKCTGQMVLYIDNCIGINSINLGLTHLECYDSTFVNYITEVSDYFISGTGSGYLSDCDFGSGSGLSYFPSSGYAIEGTTGPWQISGLTSYGGLLYEDATVVNEGQSNQGDVLQVTGSALATVNLSVNDYYFGLEDTSVPIVINIPSLVTKGKTFIIKDEDGANPVIDVTLQSDDITCLIDNQASVKMTVALSSIQLVKRGGNFFII